MNGYHLLGGCVLVFFLVPLLFEQWSKWRDRCKRKLYFCPACGRFLPVAAFPSDPDDFSGDLVRCMECTARQADNGHS